jgi:hypothetical protein
MRSKLVSASQIIGTELSRLGVVAKATDKQVLGFPSVSLFDARTSAGQIFRRP